MGKPEDIDSSDAPDSPGDTAPAHTGGDDSAPPTCPDQRFPASTLAVLDTCAPPTHRSDPIRLAPLWTNEAARASYTTPAVARLADDDGDGDVDEHDVPTVVMADMFGVVRALDGRDGRERWSIDPGLGGDPSAAALGDLDGDGRPEVVVSGYEGTVALDGGSGAVVWSVPTTATGTSPVAGGPGLADLDGDGRIEVILGRTVLSGDDGALLWDGDAGAGCGNGSRGPVGVAGDLDLDGVQEVLVGDAIYGPEGEVEWRNHDGDGYVAPVNADADPEGELVVTALGVVRLTDDDGTVLWRTELDERNSGPPTVADLDGDGAPEIAVATTTVLAALELDGSVAWRASTNDGSSGWTGVTAFDFDDDGASELVYADQVSLYLVDGATGAFRAVSDQHGSGTLGEYPVIADLDGDGDADLVYVSAGGFGPEVGVRAFTAGEGAWPWARGLWSQHGEASTTRGDLGEVPAAPTPSWLEDNRFRAAGAPPRPWVDEPALVGRILDVCEVQCAAGELVVWVALGNQGRVEAPAGVGLRLVGETEHGDIELAVESWPDPLPPGELAASRSYVLHPPGPLTGLRLEVDPTDAVAECGETEGARWSALLCADGG